MKEFFSCILCDIAGKQLYEGLTDRLLEVPGSFNLKRCPSCGLLWLDPMPSGEDIYKNYFVPKDYIVIQTAKKRRLFAKIRDFLRENIVLGYYGYGDRARKKIYAAIGFALGSIPILRSRASFNIGGFLPYNHPNPYALLVDVGCGKGDYLEKIQALGWKVMGIEPHPSAAEMSREKGVPVFEGTLHEAELAEASVDYITLMHVIEHVLDPLSLIKECLRVLKKGGVLVIRTPNVNSLGHRIFKSCNYSLDPPRHLFLFTSKNLGLLFKKCGLEKFKIKTTIRPARTIYDNNIMILKQGKTRIFGVKPQRGRLYFVFKELMLCRLGLDFGEEIEAIVQKT